MAPSSRADFVNGLLRIIDDIIDMTIGVAVHPPGRNRRKIRNSARLGSSLIQKLLKRGAY